MNVFGPSDEFDLTVTDLYDEDLNPLEVVRHPKQIVYIKMPKPVKKDYMFRDKRMSFVKNLCVFSCNIMYNRKKDEKV